MESPYVKLLRLSALFGAVAVAIKKIVWFDPPEARQEYSFYALYVTAAAVILTLLLLRKSSGKLLKNLDILVPLGLYLTADEVAGFISAEPFYFNFTGTALLSNWASITLAAVFLTITKISVGVFFAGWTTRLVLQLGESEKVDLVAGLRGVKKWFIRTLVVLGVFKFVPVFLMMPSAFFVARFELFSPWMVCLGVLTLLYNLATFAVLLFVLSGSDSLLAAIAKGVKLSCRNAGRLGALVVAQMLILGFVVYVSVHYAARETSHSKDYKVVTSRNFGRPESTKYITTEKNSHSTTEKTNTKRGTNFVWVGSYAEKSEWHEDLMQAVESTPFAPVAFKLALLLLFLAIVVKIEIARRIFGFKEREAIFFDGDLFELKRVGGFLRNERRLKAPAVLLLTGAVIYLLVPCEALFAQFKSDEAVVTNVSTSSKETSSSAAEENPALVVPKVYRGEDLFNRRQLFVNEKTAAEKSVPMARIDSIEGEKIDPPDEDELTLNDIDVIYGGEVDDEPGADILAVADRGAFVLDAAGNLKRRIDYNLGKYYDSGTANDYRLAFPKIVDLDGDGKPEIAGYGINICEILDLNGEPVWKYKGKGKGDDIDIDAMAVGDVDDDGINEVLVVGADGVEAYRRDGKLKWKSNDSKGMIYQLEIADFDGDARNDIYADNAFLDAATKDFREIKVPNFTYGALVQKNEKPAIIYFDDNQLGLFDGSQHLLGRYEAPLSHIPNQDVKKDPNKFSLGATRVFRSKAVYVKLKTGEDKYLAVYANASGDKHHFCILYIYNPAGELVYYETIKTFNGDIGVLPKDDQTESVIVTDDGRLLEYSLK